MTSDDLTRARELADRLTHKVRHLRDQGLHLDAQFVDGDAKAILSLVERVERAERPGPAKIVRLHEDQSPGGLDEVVGSGPIHVERMSSSHIWASLAGHGFDFHAQKGAHGWELYWGAQDLNALRKASS